jgi:hypothetical protein
MTVSIQYVAFINTACAFCPRPLTEAGLSPIRNAMLAIPPPNSGAAGLVEISMVMVLLIFLVGDLSAQHRIRVAQHALRDCARGDERGQVLRKPESILVIGIQAWIREDWRSDAAGVERSYIDGRDDWPFGLAVERPLGIDGCAMRDARHACQCHALFGRGRCRNAEPDPRFEMNATGGKRADVVDELLVGDTVEEDVLLCVKATIRNIHQARSKR